MRRSSGGLPRFRRSGGLRRTRCFVHLLRFVPLSGSLGLAIAGFAFGSVAPLGSFGSKLSLNAAEPPKLDAEFQIVPGWTLESWDFGGRKERKEAQKFLNGLRGWHS